MYIHPPGMSAFIHNMKSKLGPVIAPEERRRHHFGDISNVRFTKTRQRYLIKLMMSTINFIYLGISGSMSES